MSKTAKIILGCLGGIAIFFGVMITIVFLVIGNESKREEIKFGKDRIKTIYTVVGERKMSGTSVSINNGIHEKKYTYKNGEVSIGDVNKYIKELREDGFLVTKTFVDGNGQIGASSKDNGKIILIDIELDKLEETIITYKKGKGTITKY
jgi:hypothetical protein